MIFTVGVVFYLSYRYLVRRSNDKVDYRYDTRSSETMYSWKTLFFPPMVMCDVGMSKHRLTPIIHTFASVNHRFTLLLPVVVPIMRFFSYIVLNLSVLVVAIRYNEVGDGCCSATATTSVDGNLFRPKPQVAGIAKTSSPFNAAVLNVPNNDRMTPQSQRGGAMKPVTPVVATSTATNGLPKALAGAIIFAMIEKIVKMTLQKLNIAYPAQLGACIVLFIVLCMTDALISPTIALSIFTFLTPGAALLAKWFPIFFIPGLVLLPLSPPIGGTADVRTVRRYRIMLASSFLFMHFSSPF
jgi:hypothetical protein